MPWHLKSGKMAQNAGVWGHGLRYRRHKKAGKCGIISRKRRKSCYEDKGF
jgi:predicted hotdog family 3-hydroxylacyl-ACP dehydratase